MHLLKGFCRRFWFLSTIGMLATHFIVAQHTIRIQERSFRLEPTLHWRKQATEPEIGTGGSTERKVWLTHWGQKLTATEKLAYSSRGIRFLQTYADGTELVELSPVFFWKQPVMGIVSALPYPIEAKYSKDFESQTMGVQEIKIQFIPFPGKTSDEILEQWNPEWGVLDAVWKGKQNLFRATVKTAFLGDLLAKNWLWWMEVCDGEDVPLTLPTTINSRNSFVKGLHPALKGRDVKIGIGDGGFVEPHADFSGNQTNLTATRLASFADHQDHVSGIAGGKGLLKKQNEGIAPEASLFNLQTSMVISNAQALYDVFGVTLTNNSYGLTYNCARAGLYSSTALYMDAQQEANPELLHVVAAGNAGAQTCGSYPSGYMTIAEGYPVAKNVLTVGSILEQDADAWFSSKGPARDGRLKPEIVADGNEVESTVPIDAYSKKGGTSMATPVVTATLAILTERYKQLYQGNPKASLLKALVCNTADDVGAPQVDFATGFGRINTRKALRVLENGWFVNASIPEQTSRNHTVVAPPGAHGLKVMLSWNDPSPAPGSTKALMHDLDLEVRRSNGALFLPWVASALPNLVNQPAQRRKDTLNNIEQVTLPITGGESVQIKVLSGWLSQMDQAYSLVFEWQIPELVLIAPFQGQEFEAGKSITVAWDNALAGVNAIHLEQSIDSLTNWTSVKQWSAQSRSGVYLLPSTGFQKIWFRLRADLPSGPVISNVVGTKCSQIPQLSLTPCHQSIRLEWTSVEGAVGYQVFCLDREKGGWIKKAEIQGHSWVISRLKNGERASFAIRALFAHGPGVLSEGKTTIPTPGTCPWNTDLAIQQMVSPVSVRIPAGEVFPMQAVRLSLRNIGQAALTSTQVSFYCQINTAPPVTYNQLIWLESGQEEQLTFPALPLPNSPGKVRLKCWFSLANDENKANDTIDYVFEQVANPAVTLPWQFRGLGETGTWTQSSFVLPNFPMLEFNSGSNGRLSSVSSTGTALPAEFGATALILDKDKIDGQTGLAEWQIHLNLSEYAQISQLLLDVDVLPFGSFQPQDRIWVRSSPQHEWKEVLRLSSLNHQVGEVLKIRALDLWPFLESELPGAWVQLKFTHGGNRPYQNLIPGGFALDNLTLSAPSKDVELVKILSPSGSCGEVANNRFVSIRLRNSTSHLAENITVGYQIPGQPAVEATILQLAAHDSTDFQFIQPLPTDLMGRVAFYFWVRAQGDDYPTNDTIKGTSIFFSPLLSQLPYVENFEQNNGWWKSYGERSSWEWGMPSPKMSVVDTAANGKHIWASNLKGNYKSNERSFLESPCFNLSGELSEWQISFHSILDLEKDYDMLWLEISADGINWQRMSQFGEGSNWYTHAGNYWDGRRQRWGTTGIKFSTLGWPAADKVRFRFALQTDASLQYEGVGIDDFQLEPAIAIGEDSVAAIQIQNQPNNCGWESLDQNHNRYGALNASQWMNGVEFKTFVHQGEIRKCQQTPYLNRSFGIARPASEPEQGFKLRFYLTEKEVTELMQTDPTIYSFQQIGIQYFSQKNPDSDVQNNFAENIHALFIPPHQIWKGAAMGGYFFEFDAPGAGEYYLASRPLNDNETPLPITLISFKARAAVKENVLMWQTASEQQVDYFALEYACGGAEFQALTRIKSMGSGSEGHSYTYRHALPTCPQEHVVYRLSVFDLQNAKPVQQFYAYIKQGELYKLAKFENPIGDRWTLSGLQADSRIEILNPNGQSVIDQKVDAEDFQVNTQNWASGVYILKLQIGDQFRTEKLFKP